MYCSNCGTQNKEEANYCRQCGRSFPKPYTNLLPEVKQPDQHRAFRKLFTGIAFLVIASILPAHSRPMLWWLFFIGIVMVIKGVRLLSVARFSALSTQTQLTATPCNAISETSPQQIHTEVRVRQTGEVVQPPSVTENTTKLFDRQ
jgi:uncharacterized membrane protein YvbJ